MEQQDTTPNLDPVELPVASPSAAASPQPPAPAPGPPPSLTSLLPDSAFTELCTLLRCSRADVESAIRASRVDPEEAVAILHAAAPTYVAVKGRFEARKRGDLNGGFCIVADGMVDRSATLEVLATKRQASMISKKASDCGFGA